MSAFVEKLRSDPQQEHPIRFAARAHVELASIHPFVDGNGRVSRMLVNLLLVQVGYPLALYTSTNRAQYLEALELAQVHGLDEKFIAVTASAFETMLDRSLELVSMASEAENHFPVAD